MANGQSKKRDSGNYETKIIHFSVTSDDVDLPPPGLTSRFKNVPDWLNNIIENNKPKKPIDEYKIGLFESLDCYTVFLVGTNTYHEDKPNSSIRIDRNEFTPTNMYFKLPESEYKNLSREQLLHKLISELKNFAKTEKFKNSFLANANAIVFETTGEVIWSK